MSYRSLQNALGDHKDHPMPLGPENPDVFQEKMKNELKLESEIGVNLTN